MWVEAVRRTMRSIMIYIQDTGGGRGGVGIGIRRDGDEGQGIYQMVVMLRMLAAEGTISCKSLHEVP
jgi:hypothetical protein